METIVANEELPAQKQQQQQQQQQQKEQKPQSEQETSNLNAVNRVVLKEINTNNESAKVDNVINNKLQVTAFLQKSVNAVTAVAATAAVTNTSRSPTTPTKTSPILTTSTASTASITTAAGTAALEMNSINNSNNNNYNELEQATAGVDNNVNNNINNSQKKNIFSNQLYNRFGGSQEFRKSPSPLGLEAALLDANHVSYAKDKSRTSNRFIGLSEFDETQIPELPGGRYSDIEDPLRLTFDEGFIPNLTANLSTNTDLNLTNNSKKGNLNNVTISSDDNEYFSECHSYLPSLFPNESSMESFDTIEENVGLPQKLNATTAEINAATISGAIGLENDCEPMDIDESFTYIEEQQQQKQQQHDATIKNITEKLEILKGTLATKNDNMTSPPIAARPVIPVFEPLMPDNISDTLSKTSVPESMKSDFLAKIDASSEGFTDYELNVTAVTEQTSIPTDATTIANKTSTISSTLNKTLDMIASPCSYSKPDTIISNDKISTSSFPVKSTNDKTYFPKSPILNNKESVFLEKSEYAEQLNNNHQHQVINVIPMATPQKVNVLNGTFDLTKTHTETELLSITEPLNIIEDKEKRKTFTVMPEDDIDVETLFTKNNENRRTFNIEIKAPPPSPLTMQTIPKEQQQDKRRTFDISSSPGITDTRKRLTFTNESLLVINNEAVDDIEKETAAAIATLNESLKSFRATSKSPSPLLSTSPKNKATLLISKIQTTLNSAPIQIPTAVNKKRNETGSVSTSTSPNKFGFAGKKLSTSLSPPKSETGSKMMKENQNTRLTPPRDKSTTGSPTALRFSPTRSPSPQHQKKTLNKMVPPPSEPFAKTMEYKFIKPAPVEPLSAKEKLKINAKDEKDVFIDKFVSTPIEDMLAAAVHTSNNSKNNKSNATFAGFVDADLTEAHDTFEEEFRSSNNLVLNPSDFDFFYLKGGNNEEITRNSVLLRFDPLLGKPTQQQQPQQQQSQVQQLILPTTKLTTQIEERETTSPLIKGLKKKVNLELTLKSTTKEKNDSTTFLKETVGKQDYEKMSVGVIQDLNIENNTNKTFDGSSIESEDKQINLKMDEPEKKIKNENLLSEDIAKKIKEGEQKEEALLKRITEKDKTIHKLNTVIEAYEKAIAELIAEKEQIMQHYEHQLTDVKTDRDSNYQHLTSLETTFSDLHVKYEKSKEMTQQLKANEESLLVEKRQNLENLSQQEARYEKMKNHAMLQLEIANKKLETMSKEHTFETTKLKALLKKEEISRASINEQLQQKTRENTELMKICDELINGQGS